MASSDTDRRARLEAARLYFVCDAGPGRAEVVAGALRGGAQIVQLRDELLADSALASVGEDWRKLCDAHGALLIVNDRPAVAVECDADGVHLGQDDMAVATARKIVGDERLIGLSTHAVAEIGRAGGVDYIGVGPVHATPTKPGRAPVGLALVREAAAHAPVPFFAIGGIDAPNLREVLDAGARRVAVVRAISEAADPEAAARELRAALDGERVGDGQT